MTGRIAFTLTVALAVAARADEPAVKHRILLAEYGSGGNRLVEVSAKLCGDVVKCSSSTIEEQLGRLRISDIAANVAHGFIDMPVGDHEIQPAIQIDVEKCAPESQAVS